MEDWNELLGNVFVNFLSSYPKKRILLTRGMVNERGKQENEKWEQNLT